LAALEEQRLQVGLYVIGSAIEMAEPQVLSYRALKGPAAIKETPRPAWYPSAEVRPAKPNALPDWNAIYPLARRAMKSFRDGGSGFETTLDSWQIAARPVIASREACVSCHNGQVELNQLIGVCSTAQ